MNIMEKQREIEILMRDGSTREEAEKHLKNGTMIIDDFEENMDSYIKEFSDDDVVGFDAESFREMVKTKKPLPDWGVVEKDGKTYYICYCL